MNAADRPLLDVRDLSIAFGSAGAYLHAVNRVSLQVGTGEIVGLIGQSGSGKTTLATGLLGLLHGAPGVWRGEAFLDGKPLLPPCGEYAREKAGAIRKRAGAFERAQRQLLQDLRGREAAMIFQEPRAALDPYFRVGEHLHEAMHRRAEGVGAAWRERAADMLREVGLVDAESLLDLYPHEISGGMAQRVMIAMALCVRPKLLIADEPSTALDVTTQAKLLELFRRLREQYGLSILLISHDIGVIQEVCSRVYVMHRGAVVECGATDEVLHRFRHPYTGSLVEAFLRFGEPQSPPPRDPEHGPGCAYRSQCGGYGRLNAEEQRRCETDKPGLQGAVSGFAVAHTWARCHFPEQSKSRRNAPAAAPTGPAAAVSAAGTLAELRGVRKRFHQGRKEFWGLDRVSLTLAAGRTYALVGESGSGKSTLALALLVLQATDEGEIFYRGEDLLRAGKERLRALRREIRMLFQHPEAVLNGGMTVSAILAEGLEREKGLSRTEVRRRIAEVLEQVRLDAGHADRFPGNLSSGEKQRVTIARALISRPQVLVCDEPVSSLDLAIQSQIMGLLRDFQNRLGLTYLFISHNLELVKLLAHRIGVLYMGHLIEEAPVGDFTVERARHPYTRLLLASVPSAGNATLRSVCAEYPDVEPVRLEQGCPFRNRCPLYLRERHADCETAMPALRTLAGGARIACHRVEAQGKEREK